MHLNREFFGHREWSEAVTRPGVCVLLVLHSYHNKRWLQVAKMFYLLLLSVMIVALNHYYYIYTFAYNI
jgi:hypothetical protein